MRILVIDDNETHRLSALRTIVGHDVTVAGTYDEAYELLLVTGAPPLFDVVFCDLLMPAGAMGMGTKGMKYVGQEMPVGFALSLMAVLNGAKYVAVVTDTNHHDHPASAMLDPLVSRCPDNNDRRRKETPFVINGSKVAFYHSPEILLEGTVCLHCDGSGQSETCHCAGIGDSPKIDCEDCNGTGLECPYCRSTGRQWVKDWGKVLAHIIS